MAAVLLVGRAMREPTERPVTERDLEEVLLSLEAELHAPPKKHSREREDSTQIHLTPPRD